MNAYEYLIHEYLETNTIIPYRRILQKMLCDCMKMRSYV